MAEETYAEYACQYTGWIYDPDTNREVQATRRDRTGYGSEGLREANRIVGDTRAWQPHHGLPVDAQVVFRPVGEWRPAPHASVPDPQEPTP